MRIFSPFSIAVNIRCTAVSRSLSSVGSCRCSILGLRNRLAFSGVSYPRAISKAATTGLIRSSPARTLTAAWSCFLMTQRLFIEVLVHIGLADTRIYYSHPKQNQKNRTQDYSIDD